MAIFTVRVELHRAIAGDYERLHAAMEAAGYRRFIVAPNGRGGQVRWHLPTAEYDLTSDATAEAVANHAWGIANGIRANPWVLVTQSAARFVISQEF